LFASAFFDFFVVAFVVVAFFDFFDCCFFFVAGVSDRNALLCYNTTKSRKTQKKFATPKITRSTSNEPETTNLTNLHLNPTLLHHLIRQKPHLTIQKNEKQATASKKSARRVTELSSDNTLQTH
jgi:hypothetical protein